MLYSVVLVSAVQHCESVIIICIYDLSLPPNPASLGCHKVPGWIPCVIQQLPSSYFTHVRLVVCICYFLNLFYFHLPTPNLYHKSILYICVSIPSLQIGIISTVFLIPHICLLYYICFCFCFCFFYLLHSV